MAAENTTAPERLYGQGRVQTAIKVAEQSWNNAWKDSKTAVLAPSADKNLVDALAVSPLAYKLNAPILLNDAKDSINADTLKALKDQGVKKVYVATGEGVISNEAVKELKDANMEVVRLGGASRYATAKKIYDEFKANGGNADNVALVAGTGLADALSVSSIAAKEGMPILLTNGKDTVAAELKDVVKAAKKVYAVGGEGVISDALVNEFKATRLGGTSRFATNAEVIKAFAKDGKVKFNKVYLANGMNNHLVDALTGSVLAAQTESPVVLASDNLDSSVKEALKGKVTDKTNVVAFGGEAVVSGDVIEATKNVNREDTDSKELTVESVTALNLKQIQVKFNGNVDSDEGTKVDNYTLENEDEDEVKISDAEVKGNTVVLTIADEFDSDNKIKEFSVENQNKFKLTVNNKVAEKETEKEVKMVDTVIPEVKDVKVIGKDTVKVTFSEPVKPERREGVDGDSYKYLADDDAVEVKNEKGEKIYVNEVQLVNNNTEANIKLYSDIDDQKEISVKLKGDIKDYADLGVFSDEIKAKVVKDEEKPHVVGVKDVTSRKVTLVFNEDIEKNGTLQTDGDYFKDFYHTNSKNLAKKVTLDGNKVTLEFDEDSELPDGTAYIIINGGVLQDLWDNENDTIRYEIKNEKDTVKPAIKEIEQGDDEKTVKLTFTEDLDKDSAQDEDNYKIIDEDGEDVDTDFTAKLDGDKVTLTFDDDLDAGKYKVEVKGIEDKASNKIEKVSKSFEITDKTNPKFEDFKLALYGEKHDQRIVVNFGEKMMVGDNKFSVNDLDKYTLKYTIDGKEKSVKLSDYYKSDIKVTNKGKSIEIAVPYYSDESDEKTYDLQNNADYKDIKLVIARVADANENTTNEISATRDVKKKADVDKITVSAEATDTDTLKLKFGDNVKFNNDDVKIQMSGDSDWKTIDPKFEVSHDSKDNTVVTYTLDKKSDGKIKVDKSNIRVYFGIEKEGKELDIKTKNEYGIQAVYVGQITDLKDKIAPELATDDFVNEDGKTEEMDNVVYDEATNKLTITFAEKMKDEAISAALFTVSDATVTGVDIPDDHTERVVLTLNEDADVDLNTKVKLDGPIRDANGNSIEKFESKVAKVDKAEVVEDTTKEDKAAVDAAKANLAIGFTGDEDATKVTGNLTLPKTQDGCTVTWASDNAAVNADNGTVVRPASDKENATVKLTATIKKGSQEDTREFQITVLKAE
jgi:putative cell wall-binding protein/methionine-rich copper-binding protein CopC